MTELISFSYQFRTLNDAHNFIEKISSYYVKRNIEFPILDCSKISINQIKVYGFPTSEENARLSHILALYAKQLHGFFVSPK